MSKKQLSPFDCFLLVVALSVFIWLIMWCFHMLLTIFTSAFGREMLLLFLLPFVATVFLVGVAMYFEKKANRDE